MKSEIFISKSPKKTMEIARIIFLKFQKLFKDRKNGLLFALVGPLGSGKTIFVQGMAKFLGIKDRIQSPTFLIMRKYNLKNKEFINFYHLDCYRIKKKDINLLNFKKIISEPKNIIVIEWAEKIKRFLPKNAIFISFKIINEKEREIKVKF